MSQSLKPIFPNFAKFFLPGIALAVFGFLFIHTPTVQAANCGGAVVCSCGDTVTASTTLTSDLSCGLGVTGLTIGANDVTIDGNGHALVGISNQANPGIIASNFSGITIKNFTSIDYFANAINFSGVVNGAIQNNLITRATNKGIYLINSASTTIIENQVRSSGSGIFMNSNSNITITNNNILGNMRDIQAFSTSASYCKVPISLDTFSAVF